MHLLQYTPKLLLQLNIGCVTLHIAEERAADDAAVGKGVGHKITVTVCRSFSNVKPSADPSLSTWLSGVAPPKSNVYVDSTLLKLSLH
jgi:L-fucose isomerase-like protein